MFATLTAAALAAALSAGTQLVRATGPLVEIRMKGAAEKSFQGEEGIAAADAIAVIRQVRERWGEAHAVLRVPGRRALFLVVGLGHKSDDSRDLGGLRLMLVEKSGEGVALLAQSTGSADSYSLRPVVFRGAGRTIVLAEMATEYSWGLRVFEIVGRQIRELGMIDVGVPGEMGEEDPTPFARVTLEHGKVVLTFHADLVIGTGNQDSKIASKPVVFRQGAKGFVLERPRFKRRPAAE